jgi:hypothetical protein
MKLPIITTKTSYVEFDTPAYYQSKYGSFYKIYETGMLSVYKDMIDNYYILDAKGNPDEFTVNKVRELLETGTPITKEEFNQQFKITMNHLSIIAS